MQRVDALSTRLFRLRLNEVPASEGALMSKPSRRPIESRSPVLLVASLSSLVVPASPSAINSS